MDKPVLLIVEDDDALCTQYRFALHEEYAVRFAKNRAQALKQVTASKPAVITVDLGLPPTLTPPRKASSCCGSCWPPTRWPR